MSDEKDIERVNVAGQQSIHSNAEGERDELIRNINIKADFIEATLNDSARDAETISTLRAEVEGLKGEWGRAAWRAKTWRMASQARRAENISLRAERDAAIARAEKLEAALKPFAEHDDFHASDDWAVTQIDDGSPDLIPGVTAGDFKRAKAAIASLTEGE